MKKPGRRVVVLMTVLLLGAVAVVTLFTVKSSEETAANARSGGSAQLRSLGSVAGIRLDGFGSSEDVELSSFRGRPLVINYWASWCLFCIDEMPDFQSVYEDVSKDVAFLGINIQDDLSQAKRLAKVTGVRYPFASDPKGDIFSKLESRSMPTTIFVDKQGDIVERFAGPLTADQLRDRIRKHFDA